MNRNSTLKRSAMKRGDSQLKRVQLRRRRELVAKQKTLKAKPETPELKAWKKAVRARDNNTCRWPECGATENIHCHHIHTRKQRPDLVYVVENGACLCQPHHDHLHHTVEGRREARANGLLGTETYEKARKAA